MDAKEDTDYSFFDHQLNIRNIPKRDTSFGPTQSSPHRRCFSRRQNLFFPSVSPPQCSLSALLVCDSKLILMPRFEISAEFFSLEVCCSGAEGQAFAGIPSAPLPNWGERISDLDRYFG